MAKIRVGDVFSVPLDPGRLGFGQIVAHENPTYYMIAFDLASTLPLDPYVVVGAPILSAGNFFDVLIRNGRWRVLGNVPPRNDEIPFPCYKVVVGGRVIVEDWAAKRSRPATPDEERRLTYRQSMGPIILENALKWAYGTSPWQDNFRSISVDHVRDVCEKTCHFPGSLHDEPAP